MRMECKRKSGDPRRAWAALCGSGRSLPIEVEKLRSSEEWAEIQHVNEKGKRVPNKRNSECKGMEMLKSLADSGGYRSWIWLELREREVKREVSEAGEVSGLCELDKELKHYPLVAVAVGRNPYQTNSSKKEMSRFIKLLSSGLNCLHAH